MTEVEKTDKQKEKEAKKKAEKEAKLEKLRLKQQKLEEQKKAKAGSDKKDDAKKKEEKKDEKAEVRNRKHSLFKVVYNTQVTVINLCNNSRLFTRRVEPLQEKRRMFLGHCPTLTVPSMSRQLGFLGGKSPDSSNRSMAEVSQNGSR